MTSMFDCVFSNLVAHWLAEMHAPAHFVLCFSVPSVREVVFSRPGWVVPFRHALSAFPYAAY